MDNRSWEMTVFAAVADTAGFSAAGRRLGISPSAVSKLVGRVEERLGTQLFLRSTRKIQLTVEGEMYLQRIRDILLALDDADRSVSVRADSPPQGKLSVSASVGFGECRLLPILPAFLERYPSIEVNLSLSDSIVNLLNDGIDIAIRSGVLRDSSLRARTILESTAVVAGSPDYFNRHSVPKIPVDLENHNCLGFNFQRSMDEWPFCDPNTGEVTRLSIRGNAQGNNGSILRRLALDGLGLIRVGRFHLADDIRRGDLIPVLENYLPQDLEQIHAVYVGHEHPVTRVRAFIDFLVESMNT